MAVADDEGIASELEAGFRRLVGPEGSERAPMPSEETIRDLSSSCGGNEGARALMAWLARAMQRDALVLAPEGGGGDEEEEEALADVLATVSQRRLPLEDLRREVETLEAQVSTLGGPAGRLAQLANRRDRLAALGPSIARDGGAMRSCERTSHQMCVMACEEAAGLCSELAHAVSDLGVLSSSLADLHSWDGSSARSGSRPLLSQLSLENLIAQGDKHGEHVRKTLVLERAAAGAPGGAPSEPPPVWEGVVRAEAEEVTAAGLAEEHAWCSAELARLRRVHAWGEEERINATIALAQAAASHRTAEEQLALLAQGEKVGGETDAELETTLMRLQQETIAAERGWEDERVNSALPAVAAAARMLGVEALEEDVAGGRTRQEGRVACQRQALHLLRLQSARLDILELSMAQELQQHLELGGVMAAAQRQLLEYAAAKDAVRRGVERQRGGGGGSRQGSPVKGGGGGGGASAAESVVSTDALLPLHVAVGGSEEGPSRAFLSAASLTSEARLLREALSRSRGEVEACLAEHEGGGEVLGRLVEGWEEVLWTGAACGEPVCTPAELERALGQLEDVRGRLEAALNEAVGERERVQGRVERGRSLFGEFYTRPEGMANAIKQLKREAGGVL